MGRGRENSSISYYVERMLSIFLENRQLITEKGWIVSDPESPRWWGGLESYEEIIISSILVQMTRWETVAEVIENMRQRGYTNIRSLASLSEDEILSIIRKVNFSRTKAKRLRALAIEASKYPTLKEFVKYGLRDLEGIGDETYYSLLLFVGNETQFPPSEYGSRVMSRVTSMRIPKSRVRETIESNLERDLFKYKLFHSGLVTVGRTSCFKEPKCGKCILKMICKLNNNNEALRI